MADKPERVYSTNRKAFHDYHVLESIEAGLSLVGTEVKSIREGKVNLREAYARVKDGEMWLHNSYIATYDQANRFNHETNRPRKLLLHKGEISRLNVLAQEAGKTLIPLKMYDRKGEIKVLIAVARGKKQYDKRESIAEREATREIARALKEAVRQ
ncbi:MAG: SsrA-binding protein SmpB [Planctomycetaceae bacterium]|nr:MAG: SsrA-binding protein SmpB [Planctomycetaceae bacterium]